METLRTAMTLSLEIYGLTIAISMGVATLIVVMAAATSAAGGVARRRRPVPAQPRQAQSVPDAHVAVIAAAVTALAPAHRIVHIQARRRGPGWAADGRGELHHSHAISRHTRRPPSPERKR